MHRFCSWLEHNDLLRLQSGVIRVRWTELGWQTVLVVLGIGYLFMVSVAQGSSVGGSPLLAAGCFLAGLALVPFGVRRRQADLYADPACAVEGGDEVRLDPESLRARRLGGESFAVFAGELRVGPTRRSPEAARHDLSLLLDFFAPGARLQPLLHLSRRRSHALSCPFCRDELLRVEVVCERCGTELHAECAAEHGSCTSAGCSGRLVPARARAA